MLDPHGPDLTLGVIGTGAMGRGIVQVAAAAGVRVLLSDARADAAREAVGFVSRMLDRAVEKGRMASADAEAAKRCMHVVDDQAALNGCDVVIEAVKEDLAVKRKLFAALEDVVGENCILATNTSSLSVTAIAAACRRPQRVAGFHFFNPVPLMKIVEVVGGALTESWVTDALENLAKRFGHYPARTVDSPGFLVNHAGRGLGTEGLRIVAEGIAGYADVDRVLRDAAGFRMGPFELMDLTGLDVSHPVMESIYHQFYEEPRFRPVPDTRTRTNAGLIGRKVGRGFYDYRDGRMLTPEEAPPPQADDRHPIWVSPTDGDASNALRAVLKDADVALDTGVRPADESVCVVTPLGEDTTTAALAQELDPRRTMAVDTLFGLERRRTLMSTPVTVAAARDAAHAALAADGTPVTVIHDSPGFVAQRVVATIVNIGCEIAQQRIADPQTINHAVRLGLGYPRGPLELGDDLGPARVLAILEAMHAFYGDPRYRPSPWLKRRALLGVALDTPEN